MSGFHGNLILHTMVDDIISKLGVTSFVETGTQYAYTTIHVASRHSTLPVFTCEIDPVCFSKSAEKLITYPNISIFMESSEKFIDRLITEKTLGNFPMFFLDAHWNDYWPLLDEVINISKLSRFIILIDDFMVPGRSQFEHEPGGGGTLGEHRTKPDNRPSSMALIGRHLPPDCEVGYPNYDKLEAYGTPSVPHLRGHVFIIYGGQLETLTEIKLSSHYSWGGIR
jgi:hypothetical protein